MNDLSLPSPVARARDLARLIAAEADAIERGRRLTEPVVEELHGARLFRMLYPRSVGGDEVEPAVYIEAVGELARADGSVGWCASIANSTGLFAPYLEPEAARTVFGPPRSTCAWGPPNECRGIAVPGGYRVTGRWDFASGCRHASWMGAHGTVVEPDGSLRLNNFGRPTLRTWLFPVEQARLLDNWDPIGLRGTASESYTVEDLFVPEEFTGTREDPTLRREPGPLYAFPQQTLYSVGIACCRARHRPRHARRLYRAGLAQDPARHRPPRRQRGDPGRGGARRSPARRRPLLPDRHGDRDLPPRRPTSNAAPIDIPDRARARLAGSNAITSAVAVANRTYKAAGVDAIFPGSPFERRFRDIHTLSQQIQSRDAHYETVGQVLLGNPPEVFL